jgi:hypothetical protein
MELVNELYKLDMAKFQIARVVEQVIVKLMM